MIAQAVGFIAYTIAIFLLGVQFGIEIESKKNEYQLMIYSLLEKEPDG